jgi:hypothetical protein
MHILFGDETNDQPTEGVEFFIYGALILNPDQIVEVHRGIEVIRADLSLAAGESLMFASSARPDRVAPELWTDGKRRVLDLLEEVSASFLTYCVHHEIARTRSVQERNAWALNTVLWGFQKLLRERGDYGQVVLDNPDLGGRVVIGRLVSDGLRIDGNFVPLDRIVGYSQAHVEWTHCLSACDVLLGAFRYCVNQPDHDVSAAMFRIVARLLHYSEGQDGLRMVREYGLFYVLSRFVRPPTRSAMTGLWQTCRHLPKSEADATAIGVRPKARSLSKSMTLSVSWSLVRLGRRRFTIGGWKRQLGGWIPRKHFECRASEVERQVDPTQKLEELADLPIGCDLLQPVPPPNNFANASIKLMSKIDGSMNSIMAKG